VALAGRQPDGRLAGGRDPDRRVRRLERQGLDDDVVEVPVAAVVREPVAGGPGPEQDVECLAETGVGVCLVHVEAAELGVAVALAYPQVDPAARYHVQRRGLLGEQDRVVPGQHQHPRLQAQGRRAGGDTRLQHQRGRHLVPAAEVVLDQERRLEPQRLGLDVELHVVADRLRGVDVRVHSRPKRKWRPSLPSPACPGQRLVRMQPARLLGLARW
jgi:hypothetical protein